MNSATKATALSTADARAPTSTPSPTSDAPSGFRVSARAAPKDGSSTPIRSAPQSAISAPLGTKPPEFALPATMAPSLKPETVLPTQIPPLSLKATFSARSGLRKPAWNAQLEASSTLMDFVSQSAPSATPSTRPLATA